jgi:hypothetical protein
MLALRGGWGQGWSTIIHGNMAASDPLNKQIPINQNKKGKMT